VCQRKAKSGTFLMVVLLVVSLVPRLASIGPTKTIAQAIIFTL